MYYTHLFLAWLKLFAVRVIPFFKFVSVFCEFSGLQLSLIWPSIPRSALQRAYKGMIQKIIASINKLKMKQRGVYFIDFLVYSGSFNI